MPEPIRKGISASLMCADLLNLEKDIKILENSDCAYLHFDIMDGNFVPNIALSPDLVKSVRRVSKLPADIHLMVRQPEIYLKSLEIHPGDIVSVHLEATEHIQRILSSIRDMGGHPAAAINPGTPLCMIEEIIPDIDMLLIMTVNPGYAGQKLIPQTIEKIANAKRLSEEREKYGYNNIILEADGCVSFENAVKMKTAGIEIYVAGTSSIFKKGETDGSINLEKNICDFLKIIN
ncbi:MAG: ribulose-phosphate 3-epimerase [Oscillospiraceae bacterium]|nr:ribulose-phosphate 3-epimerase [Oscillospiraceae bacterium]